MPDTNAGRRRPTQDIGGGAGGRAWAQHPAEPYDAKVAAASPDGLTAIKRFRAPEGLEVRLFAAEPLLANPVAFASDERGRFYVAETFRLHDGVTDIRGHMDWLDDDLACRTVADRVAMYHKRLGDKFGTYAVHHDRDNKDSEIHRAPLRPGRRYVAKRRPRYGPQCLTSTNSDRASGN
ncbi:MAG TPA: hypothetical protein VGN42_17495 [Pirellulales bacterium]|nr:hypothetical protein [Pirellulales bacterium]